MTGQSHNPRETAKSPFGPADEAPHDPGHDAIWQESSWVYFGDAKGMGGGIHTSEKVNQGKASVFALCFADGHAYRRAHDNFVQDRAIRASGRFSAGPYVITPVENGVHVAGHDEGFDLDLTFSDQSPSLRYLTVFPNPETHPGTAASSINIQSPGRVRGTMRIGERTFDVDAWAQRGHSWGNRDHKALRGNGSRWVTGSLGDRLNFSTYVAIRGDGLLIQSGFVVDQGVVRHTSDIDVTVEMALDGLTFTGGTVRMTYPDRSYVFRCKLENMNLVQHHGSEISIGGGTMRVDGIDQTGYTAWEINDRPPSPAVGVPFSLGSLVTDGVYPKA